MDFEKATKLVWEKIQPYLIAISSISTSDARSVNIVDFVKAIRDALFLGCSVVFIDIIPFLNDRNLSGIHIKDELSAFICAGLLSLGYRYFKKNNITSP